MKQKIDFIKFIEDLYRIESGEPVKLEEWQKNRIFFPIFSDLNDNGLRKYNLALIGLGKKNGKSEMAGMVASYMLLGDGEVDPEVISVANDKDQAKIVFERTKRAFERSPVLKSEVTIRRDSIEVKKGYGVYRVISADSTTAHGLNASCTIFDELWGFRNYDLWEALTHSPARKQALHFIITYSSYEPWDGALLWDLYQRGIKGEDPRQYTCWLSGDDANPASWVTPEYLEQQQRRLPEHIFKRLHRNEFTSGAGVFISRDDIDIALNPALDYRSQGKGNVYYMSVDLGLVKDKTVVTVVHKDRESKKIILDSMKTFEGIRGDKLKIDSVESYIINQYHAFRNVKSVVCDPWQMVSTVQRLKGKGIPIEEFIFTASNITKLTENLFSLFKDRRIEIYDHPELIKELLSVVVVEKSYGFRIDHESGAHDDHVISLGMASLMANSEPEHRVYTADEVFTRAF